MTTQPFNQFGFHFVGGFSQAEVGKYFGLLNDTNPACNTILGAAQYDQAFEFAKTAVKHYKNRIIFRHFINKTRPEDSLIFEPQAEDTGRASRMTAKSWWNSVGKKYIDSGLTLLPSNEDMSADLTVYSKWMAEVMQLAGDQGVAIAYGRFSTHNPPKHRFSELEGMFRMAGRYGKLHTYSPNIYYAFDNLDGFSYIHAAIAYARTLGVELDPTVGEFAILRNIRDAYQGYKAIPLSGRIAMRDAALKGRQYLPGIPFCGFAVGKWPVNSDTFSYDTDALDELKSYLTPITIVAPPPPPPPPVPQIPPTFDALPALKTLAGQMRESLKSLDETIAKLEKK